MKTKAPSYLDVKIKGDTVTITDKRLTKITKNKVVLTIRKEFLSEWVDSGWEICQ